jgi:GT2 family glycosyltransferase
MIVNTDKYPLVSIITVNYNQPEVTGEFLLSIQQITYPNYEIIVVDNASTKQGIDELMKLYEHIKFIKSPVNVGFAGGNNIGLKAAEGEYILFINNDTEVDKDFLQPLVCCFKANKFIGIASPKIKYFDRKNIIQYAGGVHINALTGRGKFIGSSQQDYGQYDHNTPTELIHGAAMLVSRKLIQTIGLMDEVFFLYYEELDWCERAKKNGFSLYYVGQSVIYHKESVSVGKKSPLRVYYMTRNRLLFMRKNYTGFSFYIGILFFALMAFPKNTIIYLLQGKFDLLQAFLKGILWHINPVQRKTKLAIQTT